MGTWCPPSPEYRRGERGEEAATKEDSPQLSKDNLGALGAACLAEIERREKPAADLQCESAVQPGDQGRQNLAEERTSPEGREANSADERKWPGWEKTRIDETGQAVSPRREDDIHSQERQPLVSAGFSTRQPLPVVESRCAVRGRTRRKTFAVGFDRPVLIAAACVSAAATHRPESALQHATAEGRWCRGWGVLRSGRWIENGQSRLARFNDPSLRTMLKSRLASPTIMSTVQKVTREIAKKRAKS